MSRYRYMVSSTFLIITVIDITSAYPKCIWRGTSPFCRGSCLENEFELRQDPNGDGYACAIGAKSLCCPSTWRNQYDVLVCSHKSYKGECEHINRRNGECHNLKNPKTASSINTKDGCAVLYDQQNCGGYAFYFAPGTPHHGDFSQLEYTNDRAVSIGPCYPKM